ncbi:choline/carnitine/betaine transporter [Alkaliphilus metalliredigens QYMF]|uniref:Choline/carnitine/betaine transporter n=1 Tax=Alkaliphilus metalliredigens (strain QYMF) TaxID=293826 RepID=A6TTS7_ALKMQ|nr:BCCT family transporter [Alkaliphilus metalliredigens]ABR49595.1 choline/carnitine/betaine transporter [Alkaliphilus metalliredigens QYMF]
MDQDKDKKIDPRKALAKKLKNAEIEARKKAIKARKPFKGLQIRPTVSLFDEAGKQEPGENNWEGFGFDIHPQVTMFSVVFLAAFISLTLIFTEASEVFFDNTMTIISKNAGWFFILVANLFIIAALTFAFGKFGNIRIGGSKAQPEFSKFAWYSMLLSAGMGIGLLFWSVAEPITHLNTPSPMFGNLLAGSPRAAQAAMATTFFHWGIHPWAIYALVGLGLAFFSFNRGLPLTIRSIFYPIIGNKIYGFWGNLIDTLSVLATLTGLATSLGFGVAQVNAGLNYLFGINISITVQVLLIAGITALATGSVVMGLDGGVKRLSEINMVMAGVFLLFVLIVGPTVYILGGFTQNIGYYLSNFTEMSMWTETFRDTGWQGGWTIFYWAWWISWSPFVGMFIARISKGRTVKEFVLGVMIIPTLLSFFWMSVFGGTAIFLETSGIADIATVVDEDVSIALFAMLENLPLSSVTSFIGIMLVTVFFVTSSDSGSLVVDHLTSGGKLDSPVPQRVFWAIMEGVVAATLLLGGGLGALQTASIITGLPFAIILLLIIYSLYAGLKQEFEVEEIVRKKLISVREDHVINEVISAVVLDDALVDEDENKQN